MDRYNATSDTLFKMFIKESEKEGQMVLRGFKLLEAFLVKAERQSYNDDGNNILRLYKEADVLYKRVAKRPRIVQLLRKLGDNVAVTVKKHGNKIAKIVRTFERHRTAMNAN